MDDGISCTSGTLLKDKITKNYQELCNAIDCHDSFLTLLYTNDIITQGLMSEVKSIHDNTTKAAKILDFLKDCRTDADVPKVVDILKTSGYSRAADIITGPINLPSSTASYGYQGVVGGYIQRQELQKKALKHLTTKPNRDTRITFPVVVLHGFGGNGKSQMARRLVQVLTKEADDSKNITNLLKRLVFRNITKCSSLWINAVSEGSVIEGFRNFANVAKEENISGFIKKFYQEWKDRKLLLVFDDGDDFEMLKKFLPLDDTKTNVKVIITAHSEWACSYKNVKNIPVSNFTVKEFKNFISEAVSCSISEQDSKQLEGHTGRIPAILSLVCKGFSQRFKRDQKYTISKHFAKYGTEIFTFGEDGKLAPGLTASDYKKSARIVVEQQLACMDNWKSDDGPELIELAKFILNCIAYCDPVGISEMQFFQVHPQILSKANGDYDEIKQAIGILKEFGWIELVENFYFFTTYSIHACYQIGLQSQLDEQTSESILHGMIEYMHAGSSYVIFNERYSHLAAFWPYISSPSKRSSLLNHATETNHCLRGLARNGLMDEFKSLASAYQDQGQLVHALLEDEKDLFSSASPMYYLLCKCTNHELAKYFITEIKGYYDHLQDSDEKAWIRIQLLFALTGAIDSNAYEIFKFILDSFDLNVNEGRQVLIHSAVRASSSKFVQLLIEKGGDVNEKDVLGRTPLHKAVERGGVETVKLLVENGVNIHEKNGSGQTALHVAVFESNLEVVKLLIEKGVNVNGKDVLGQTPLHIAVWERHFEIVRFLVENGANIYEINGDGDTPLQLAVKYKRKYIVDYFISISQSHHT